MKNKSGCSFSVFVGVLIAGMVSILGFSGTAYGEIVISQNTITHDARTVVMDFVSVGNAGNNATHVAWGDKNLGAVDYKYKLGQYEVTEAQWNAYTGTGGGGNMPKGNVTWYDAAKFTNWLTTGDPDSGVYTFAYTGLDITGVSIDRSYRNSDGDAYALANENEWFKAAYYDPDLNGGAGGYWTYPTRNDTIPDGGLPVLGNNNQANWNRSTGGDWGVNLGVGSYADVYSAYGAYDMAGNVGEWVETEFNTGQRMLMGGDRASTDSLIFSSNYASGSKVPTATASSDGFRVVMLSIPEPTTALLLLIGGLALVSRRRFRM